MRKVICFILSIILMVFPLAGVYAEEGMNSVLFTDIINTDVIQKNEICIPEMLPDIKPVQTDEVVSTKPNPLGAASGGRYYYYEIYKDEISRYMYDSISDAFAQGETVSYMGFYLGSPQGDSEAIAEDIAYIEAWIQEIMVLYALDNPEDAEFSGAYMMVTSEYVADEHAGYFRAEYVPHPHYKAEYKTDRDKFVNNVVAEAKKLSGNYAKIRYAHDTIINASEFDAASLYYYDATSKEYFFSNASFGITENGKSGFAGYAKMFKQILDKLGYENMLAMNDARIWNIVKIDAQWYVVDCVMGDINEGNMHFLAPVIVDTLHSSDFYIYPPTTALSFYDESGAPRRAFLENDNLYAGNAVEGFTLSGENSISILSQQWTEEDSDVALSSADVFEDGKVYEYSAVLKAHTGNEFDGPLEIWVYGSPDIVVDSIVSDDCMTAEISLKMQVPKKISGINLSLKEPIPGKEISKAEGLPEKGIDVVEMWVDNETGELVTQVVAGRQYIYVVIVTAAEGYAIADDATLTVNGITWEDSVNQIQSVAGVNIMVFIGLMTAKEHTHKEVILPSKSASCTEDGITEGKVCETCGEVLKSQSVIPGGHKYVTVVEDGIKTTTCSGCDYEESHALTPEEIKFFESGDINYDGRINSTDLSALLSAYGTDDVSADLDFSGVVNSTDLSMLLSNYGKAL